MENNNWSFNQAQQSQASAQPMARTFLASVFTWMSIALGISAVTAYVFSHNPDYMGYLINPTGGMSVIGYIVVFSPLIFVLGLQAAFNKMSQSTLTLLFLLFSLLMGVSLSFVFLAYTAASVYNVFLITAGMFAGMAVLGYTTKTDLTKFGTILIMGMWGIVLASLVNFFMGSDKISYIIGFIGVIIFTGMTAYDVQKLKNIGATAEAGSEATAKLSILGALHLYLDFINLFISLLRVMGNRRS